MSNNLTNEQRELQKQVIDIIVSEIILKKNDIDVIFDNELYYDSDRDDLLVNFFCRSKESTEHVYSILKHIRESVGIWFDSAFYVNEPLIEWSLDWSLAKTTKQ